MVKLSHDVERLVGPPLDPDVAELLALGCVSAFPLFDRLTELLGMFEALRALLGQETA